MLKRDSIFTSAFSDLNQNLELVAWTVSWCGVVLRAFSHRCKLVVVDVGMVEGRRCSSKGRDNHKLPNANPDVLSFGLSENTCGVTIIFGDRLG